MSCLWIGGMQGNVDGGPRHNGWNARNVDGGPRHNGWNARNVDGGPRHNGWNARNVDGGPRHNGWNARNVGGGPRLENARHPRQQTFITSGFCNINSAFLDLLNTQNSIDLNSLSPTLMLSSLLCGKARIRYSGNDISADNRVVLPDSIRRMLYTDKYKFIVESNNNYDCQDLVRAVNYLIVLMPWDDCDITRFNNLITIGVGYQKTLKLGEYEADISSIDSGKLLYNRLFEIVFEFVNLIEMGVLGDTSNNYSTAVKVPTKIIDAWSTVARELPYIRKALNIHQVPYNEAKIDVVVKLLQKSEIFYTPYEHISESRLKYANLEIECSSSCSFRV